MMEVMSDVQVETMHFDNGALVAAGPVGQSLLANGMNPGILRPYWDPKARRPVANVNGQVRPVANATLRKDEWIELDQAVQRVARERLRGVADLESRGLVFNLKNGLGTTVFEYETMSDAGAADLSMDGLRRTQNDRVEYGLKYLPIPIVHMDFRINARQLEASRTRGDNLQTTMTEQATRRVAEKLEDILFNGSGTFTYGGGTIYGYKDFPQRAQVTLSTNWDALTKDSTGTIGEKILSDVQDCIKAAGAANHFGPFILYIPKAYGYLMGSDYTTGDGSGGSTAATRTIRERLMALEEISDIRIADKIDANNVFLVEMSSETVQLINGMNITPVEWKTDGGMALYFKVMGIKVPLIRADYENQSGIVHLA